MFTVPPDSKGTKLGSSDQEASPSAGKNNGVVLVSCYAFKCVPTAVSGRCRYIRGPWASVVTTDEFSVRVIKITSCLSDFDIFFYSDAISCNIDEVLSINPSAKVFVFGEFNVDHKDWLTFTGGTGRPGELCGNFSISSDLNQMDPCRDSHSSAILHFFLSSDASICSTMAFA